MHGAGNEAAITSAEPPARLLDVTRLVSRAGHGPLTGVDRVELAYLERFLAEPVPAFVLARTRLGDVLLGRAGAQALRARMAGEVTWGPVDIAGRLLWRGAPARGSAEADLRRLALARAPRGALGGLLARHLPAGTDVFNTGHSALTQRRLATLKAGGRRLAVLVHDMIPLDHPEFARAGQSGVFARKMRAVSAHADLVICNSYATEARVRACFSRFGRVPKRVVAHLGVDLATATRAPEGAGATPYFVAVGTIEPRKNHALLLDVWEILHREMSARDVPHLYVAGARGWAAPALFARLEKMARTHGTIHEINGLDDGALAALVAGSRGLLFPSLAEGYGLPPLEAMGRGVPVLCCPLAISREILGNTPLYLKPSAPYDWAEAIKTMAGAGQEAVSPIQAARGPVRVPTWDEHFERVFAAVAEAPASRGGG